MHVPAISQVLYFSNWNCSCTVGNSWLSVHSQTLPTHALSSILRFLTKCYMVFHQPVWLVSWRKSLIHHTSWVPLDSMLATNSLFTSSLTGPSFFSHPPANIPLPGRQLSVVCLSSFLSTETFCTSSTNISEWISSHHKLMMHKLCCSFLLNPVNCSTGHFL